MLEVPRHAAAGASARVHPSDRWPFPALGPESSRPRTCTELMGSSTRACRDRRSVPLPSPPLSPLPSLLSPIPPPSPLSPALLPPLSWPSRPSTKSSKPSYFQMPSLLRCQALKAPPVLHQANHSVGARRAKIPWSTPGLWGGELLCCSRAAQTSPIESSGGAPGQPRVCLHGVSLPPRCDLLLPPLSPAPFPTLVPPSPRAKLSNASQLVGLTLLPSLPILYPRRDRPHQQTEGSCLNSFRRLTCPPEPSAGDSLALEDYFHKPIGLSKLSDHWASRDERFRQVPPPPFPARVRPLPLTPLPRPQLRPFVEGARMLRQDPLECLFSFICSSNNHISRIHGMVERLASNYGAPIEVPLPPFLSLSSFACS